MLTSSTSTSTNTCAEAVQAVQTKDGREMSPPAGRGTAVSFQHPVMDAKLRLGRAPGEQAIR